MNFLYRLYCADDACSRRRSALWVAGLVGRRPLNAGGSTFPGTLNRQQAGRRGILMTTERMEAEGRLRLMPQQIVVFSVRADTEAAAVLVREAVVRLTGNSGPANRV